MLGHPASLSSVSRRQSSIGSAERVNLTLKTIVPNGARMAECNLEVAVAQAPAKHGMGDIPDEVKPTPPGPSSRFERTSIGLDMPAASNESLTALLKFRFDFLW